MRKVVHFTILFLLAFCVYAQDAGRISELLQTKEATYGQAAYLAAVYKNAVADDATEQAAFAAMVEQGYISASKNHDDIIPLQDIAKLFALTTELKGGLFYSLFHSSRYAYRELKAKGILPQTTDPAQSIAGRDAITVLNNCIELTAEGAEK